EEVEHTQVGLVTRVLDQLPFGGPHWQQHRPWLLPGSRVADRQSELEPALAHTGVALGQMQTGRGPAVVVLAVEIRCLDDQSVTFPPAARVADPSPDVLV